MKSQAVSLRGVLLPKEHGSWSLAFEPMALFLLVAPSLGGGALALAAAAGFMGRRPCKLALTLPASDPRRSPARKWAVALILLSVVFLLAAAVLGGARALWPLLLAAPFAGLFLWFDLRQGAREAEAEIAGSTAFALVPVAGASLAGWALLPALALAALSLSRNLTTVLTLRTCLRRVRGLTVRVAPALLTAAITFALCALLAQRDLVPITAAALGGAALARAAWLVSATGPRWSARRLGSIEAGLGAAQLAVLTFAYAL